MLGLFASKAKIVPPQPSQQQGRPVAAPVEVPEPVVQPPPSTVALAGMLSRQPIVDPNLTLHGYALLFDSEHAGPALTGKQTAQNYSLLLPESEKTKGFIPATRELLLGAAEDLPRNTVLELGETLQLDDELIATCRQLRKRGYRLAVDGTIPTEARAPLKEFADYLTVDFGTLDEEARKDLYAGTTPGQTTLVARRVDTSETMQRAQKEGCKLFQGGFLTQPFAPPLGFKASKIIPDNQLICLRLMAALSEETINLGSIEKLIMMDTALVLPAAPAGQLRPVQPQLTHYDHSQRARHRGHGRVPQADHHDSREHLRDHQLLRPS